MDEQPTRFRLRPYGRRLVVLPIEESPTVQGGLIVAPEHVRETPTQGKVLAIGVALLDVFGADTKVAVGDTVVYAKFTGTPFVIDGIETLILEEQEILAVVDAAPAVSQLVQM